MTTARFRRAGWLAAAVVLCASGVGLGGYTYNPSDFATEVVAYDGGTGGFVYDRITADPFDDPAAALGRPTVDSTGDGWFAPTWEPAPIVPVSPAYRHFEIVQLGFTGSITLKFEKRVTDDPTNPHGVDFIVFGNAMQMNGGGDGWENRDPGAVTVDSPGSGLREPGTVSVSQDGATWYSYGDFPAGGPWADDFAPTLGRVYDTVNPHQPDGDWSWNLWWGEETDPTLPLNPAWGFGTFGGQTVTQISQAYGQSAGGTGFDLADLGVGGLDWIQYVRVTNPNTAGATAEVDAIADVAPPVVAPGDLDKNGTIDDADIDLLHDHLDDADYDLGYDLTGDDSATRADVDHLVRTILGTQYGDADLDGHVNFDDFLDLQGGWTLDGGWARGDFNGDGTVNFDDFLSIQTGWTGSAGGVPEPATALLLLCGLAALGRKRR